MNNANPELEINNFGFHFYILRKPAVKDVLDILDKHQYIRDVDCIVMDYYKNNVEVFTTPLISVLHQVDQRKLINHSGLASFTGTKS